MTGTLPPWWVEARQNDVFAFMDPMLLCPALSTETHLSGLETTTSSSIPPTITPSLSQDSKPRKKTPS
ncbi:hypothetical protein TNCV_4960911 [Trichonephila clavipes]|uniref:Uncharacterized protein n=1 Tax=Trichonephila clavipes TaxID=2585209 RepID=A0A8X6SI23_TRICX|nr:hypothetical protein TNCV_4960911 [Trichonephila clavipes]